VLIGFLLCLVCLCLCQPRWRWRCFSHSCRRNFAYFFTFWDERYGTSHKVNKPSTLLFLATQGAYHAIMLAAHYLEFHYFSTYFTTWLLAYVLIPPSAAAALAEYAGLPEATRRLFGWLMDAFRRDSYVTYAPEGAPGAFKPTPDAGASTPSNPRVAADGQDDDAGPARDQHIAASVGSQRSAAGQGKPPVYMFACHPTGLLSRGAFLTFGARGWASPVSRLPKVRMAVANVLLQFPLPFSREFLLACGCIPAEWSALKVALQGGTSVAITPGGWAESLYVQSYKLVLKRRRGFVALAAETGAVLVPVLACGEQDIAGPAEPFFQIVKWVLPQRAHPVHMVFGEVRTVSCQMSACLHIRTCPHIGTWPSNRLAAHTPSACQLHNRPGVL
jgi:hypothetical protein